MIEYTVMAVLEEDWLEPELSDDPFPNEFKTADKAPQYARQNVFALFTRTKAFS